MMNFKIIISKTNSILEDFILQLILGSFFNLYFR
jgi:hypothetical protein